MTVTRRHWLRSVALVALGLGMSSLPPAVAVAAPSGRFATQAANTAILRSAEPFGAPSLDPASAVTSYIVQLGLGEALMRITPQGTLEPWLAEAIEPVDPLRWRVRLRPGVTFWNDRPMDAAATKAAIDRVVAKRPATANLLGLASVEVTGPLSLDLVTGTPNGALVASVAGANLIIHDAEHAARVGDDAFASAPMLTGPFMPTEFRVREFLAARRYTNYWQGTPALEGIAFRAVSDPNARVAAVLAGDVDMARQIPVQAVEQVRVAGLSVVSGDEQAMNQIYLNHTRAPFDELAVRQAVSLGIDRQALVDGVLDGSASVASGPYPNFFPFADPQPLPVDPVAAGAVLDSAGWIAGADGLRARSGQSLAFELTTYPQRPELTLLATVIQAQLRDLGIEVVLRQVEQITPVVNSRDYQATMYRLGTAPTADPGFVLNTVYASWGADNGQLGYRSDRLDALVTQLNAAISSDDRLQLGLQAQAVLRSEVPSVFLLSPKLHMAVRPGVRNLEYHPFDIYLVNHTLALA